MRRSSPISHSAAARSAHGSPRDTPVGDDVESCSFSRSDGDSFEADAQDSDQTIDDMAPLITANGNGDRRGPHPSYIEIAKPYIFQSAIGEALTSAGVSEARDDGIRLQGIAWIDNVRKALHLPVRTYNTAAVYYHKFRLVHPEANGYIDAAAAALFTACKIEDTLKKSREILCAAYNQKISPSEHLTPDDPMFEQHSKTIIGLERLMLEASGFDFRNRYPQKFLVKLAKHYRVDRDTVGRTAYDMSLDLYRTFAPLKQTAATMAVSCLELSARIWDQRLKDLEGGRGYRKLNISRAEVMETLLDLVDLYTHHRTVTIIGHDHPLEKFIGIRITLNQEASAHTYPRYTQSNEKVLTNGVTLSNGTSDGKHTKKHHQRSPSTPKDVVMNDAASTSPTTNGAPTPAGPPSKPGVKEGTVRFMLDPQRAQQEKDAVADFFKVEEEVIEIEVPIERPTNDRERRRA